jgi:hypothetical protein
MQVLRMNGLPVEKKLVAGLTLSSSHSGPTPALLSVSFFSIHFGSYLRA